MLSHFRNHMLSLLRNEVLSVSGFCSRWCIKALQYRSNSNFWNTGSRWGYIGIYKKRGDWIHKNPLPGTIAAKIVGYSSYREFYSPKYTPENINSEKPDHRITLYWNPNIITVNGKASVSFFTSDDISRFRVFVEGITNSGKICLGTSEFEVNIPHTNLDR